MKSLIPISIRYGFQQVHMISGVDGSEDLPLYENSMTRIVTSWGDQSLVVEPQELSDREEDEMTVYFYGGRTIGRCYS